MAFQANSLEIKPARNALNRQRLITTWNDFAITFPRPCTEKWSKLVSAPAADPHIAAASKSEVTLHIGRETKRCDICEMESLSLGDGSILIRVFVFLRLPTRLLIRKHADPA